MNCKGFCCTRDNAGARMKEERDTVSVVQWIRATYCLFLMAAFTIGLVAETMDWRWLLLSLAAWLLLAIDI